MTGTRFEQAALDLAEAGYHVFPCHERGKEPRVGGGFKAATRDERQILSWWDRWPTANIGVACGATGIAVLDIDSKAGADPDDVLGDLDIAGAPVVRSGEAPEPSARYPRSLAGVRGAQVFFKGALRTTNKIGIPGAEIRAVGALVVVPPSVHPSGVEYVGTLPPVEELPAVPDWLREMVQRNEHQRAEPVGDTIPKGEQHATLVSLAGSMRRRGMGADEIEGALLVTNHKRLEDPAPPENIRRIAESVARLYPPGSNSPNGANGHPRATLTSASAPTAAPACTLDELLHTFKRWLYLPDPGVVHVVLGAIAANLLDGDPVWLVLVGAPGSGKSETLQAAGGLPDVHPAATLTEPALLSGTSRKEHAADAKGGLLRAVGDFGLILCKDFGSVLNMQRDARAAVLAALREIYDGAWTRHVGTDGGKTLAWTGKVGLLAGCTQTIDRHHAVMGAMGERFVLYRMPPASPDEQARRALSNAGHEGAMRDELSAAVTGLFRDGLPATPPALTAADGDRLIALATLAVRCRSAVERDGYSREVELVPDPESPARLVKVLARLHAGICATGADTAVAWRVVTKCALDSIPALRLAVIDYLHANPGEQSTTDIAHAVAHPAQTTRRALEDLAAHGLVERHNNGQGKADTWQLRDWTAQRYTVALTVPETSGDTHA